MNNFEIIGGLNEKHSFMADRSTDSHHYFIQYFLLKEAGSLFFIGKGL